MASKIDYDKKEQQAFPYYYDERETVPRLKNLTMYYRSGEQVSQRSPRVNGKLKLRANPYRQISRSLLRMVPKPFYHDERTKTKIRGYYTVSPDVSMRIDTDLVTRVRNLSQQDLVSGLRDAKIDVGLHLTEFYKNLSWFDKRFSECASLVSAILTKKGRVELLQKLLTKDQRRFQRLRNIYETYGTLPKEFHSDPRYFPKKNRRFIVRDLQNALNIREKSLHKEVADLTLEWSYAISPIVQDVRKLATKIDNYDFLSFPIKISKTRVSTNTYRSGSGDNETVHTTTTKARCAISGYITLNDPTLNTLEQFGFSNLPALLWELTWASFVFDWCVPIGNWLGQFHALDGWSLSGINTTTTTKAFCTSFHSKSGAWGNGTYTEKIRELGVIPTYKIQILNPITSLRRAINQIALAVSLGSKR